MPHLSRRSGGVPHADGAVVPVFVQADSQQVRAVLLPGHRVTLALVLRHWRVGGEEALETEGNLASEVTGGNVMGKAVQLRVLLYWGRTVSG